MGGPVNGLMTLARFFLRAMVWVLIAMGLTVGIALGRLSTGPVVLDWMRPNVERALTPGNSDIQVTVGRAELRLDESRRTIELVGLDVRYRSDAGRPFLTFPEVNVALSVEAFLKHGLVAASNVEARAPSLRLTRGADGKIGLYSTDTVDSQTLSEADIVDFLRHLVLAPKSDDRIAFLKRLQISGGTIVYDDQIHAETLTAKAADLVLIRQKDGVNGWLRADLVQGEGRASLQLLGRTDMAAETVHLDVEARNLVLADLAETWRLDFPWLPREFDQVRSPVQASFKSTLDFEGRLSPVEVDLRMVDGLLDLPDHLATPLDVTLGEFQGLVTAGFDAIDVKQFRLISRGAEFNAGGRVSWQNDEPSIKLDLMASQVRVEDFSTFWPPGFGEDGRRWVMENIKTGLVPKAEARLELRPSDFGPQPLRDNALKGTFTFEELSVRYVDTMPPIERGFGTASFDADRLHFDVRGGENAGVRLKNGTVTITGVGKPGREATQLTVLAEAEGSIDRTLSLLDHPPLDVAKDLDIAPEQTSGEVRAKLDIRMPLHDDVSEDEVDVLADAKLSQVAINGLPRLGPDILLEQGAFDLVVGSEAVRLDGTADIAGLPVTIDIEEPLIEGTAKRRILVSGQVTKAMADRLDLAVEGVDGALAFKATMTETSDNIWVDLEADLLDLAVAFPGITWQKAAGEKGKLLASIAVPNEGPIDVKQFEVSAPGLKAAGSLALSQPSYQVSKLALTNIQLGNSQGALHLRWDDEVGQEIIVEAEMLDLDSLLAGDDGHDDLDLDFDRLHMAIRADHVIYRGVQFQDIQADAFRLTNSWRTASFLGSLSSGDKIALELVPDGDLQRLEIRSDDAGALIMALGLGQRLDGGAFHLSATLTSQNPVIANGRLEINRFTLANAPLLARLLTVASLTGIGNLLEGEGIQFDNMILPFAVEDQVIDLKDGLLRGSQIGLTTKGAIDLKAETLDLAGTIIPVYSINRLIGQVPIIGRILTGSDGRGAFAATYRINGPRNQPTFYVNPLSILAPGLIRDFFGILTKENPEPAE